MKVWMLLEDGRVLSGDYEYPLLMPQIFEALIRPEVVEWGTGEPPGPKDS